MKPLTAYVMAGGKSSRFGEPKALAKFKGKRLIDYALCLAETLTDTVIVGVEKGNPFRLQYPYILEDTVSGAGPVGGVYSVLKHLKEGWVAIIPCDMPFLDLSIYTQLMELAEKDLPVVACSASGIEPLVSVWPTGFLSELEPYIQKKDYKILNPLVEHCAAQVHFSDKNCQKLFTNINSLSDITLWTG